MNRPDIVTNEDAERLLREAAIREGASLPKNVHELEIMNETAPPEVEVPDFRRVLARVRGEHPSTGNVVRFNSAADSEVTAELAMAARNGDKIPVEIRCRMNADRELAEEQQDHRRHG